MIGQLPMRDQMKQKLTTQGHPTALTMNKYEKEDVV